MYVDKVLREKGKIFTEMCGNAEIIMVESQEFVSTATELLKQKSHDLFFDDWRDCFMKWFSDTGIKE